MEASDWEKRKPLKPTAKPDTSGSGSGTGGGKGSLPSEQRQPHGDSASALPPHLRGDSGSRGGGDSGGGDAGAPPPGGGDAERPPPQGDPPPQQGGPPPDGEPPSGGPSDGPFGGSPPPATPGDENWDVPPGISPPELPRPEEPGGGGSGIPDFGEPGSSRFGSGRTPVVRRSQGPVCPPGTRPLRTHIRVDDRTLDCLSNAFAIADALEPLITSAHSRGFTTRTEVRRMIAARNRRWEDAFWNFLQNQRICDRVQGWFARAVLNAAFSSVSVGWNKELYDEWGEVRMWSIPVDHFDQIGGRGLPLNEDGRVLIKFCIPT